MAARRRHVEKRADSQLCPARGRHAFCRRGSNRSRRATLDILGRAALGVPRHYPWTKIIVVVLGMS